jgi:hypothetical protein
MVPWSKASGPLHASGSVVNAYSHALLALMLMSAWGRCAGGALAAHHADLGGHGAGPAGFRQLGHPGFTRCRPPLYGSPQVLRCSSPPGHAPLPLPLLLLRHLGSQPPQPRILALRVNGLAPPSILSVPMSGYIKQALEALMGTVCTLL